MKGVVVVAAVMVVLAMLVMVQPGQAVISCQQVDSSVAPCIPYLTTGAGNPTVACCNGLSGLKQITPTTNDRRAACECLKEAASRFPDLKEDAATALPTKCHIQTDIPISKNVNCNDVQ